MAADIGAGDEVVVTPFSFIASVSIVIEAGATPVFADIDPQTFVMDPASVADRVGPRTKAVLPVHQCGYPVDMKSIREIAGQNRLVVIEDCAAAHGARIDGQYVGVFGDYGCFSFNIGKIMRTGEGGMVTTQDPELCRRLRSIRVNGLEPGPAGERWVARLGSNFTLSQPLAALGRVQVKRFHALSERRRAITKRLQAGLAGLPVSMSPDRPGLERACYSVILVLREDLAPRREEIVRLIQSRGVPVDAGNPQLLNEVEYVRRLSRGLDCPNASRARPRMMFFDPLPVYSDAEVDRCADAIRDALAGYA